MRKLATVLALGGICGAVGAQTEDSEAPDLELLEYLGSWQAEDDEWLAIAEWEKDRRPPRAKREADDAERDEGERKRNDDD
jgi:hypothetical protein